VSTSSQYWRSVVAGGPPVIGRGGHDPGGAASTAKLRRKSRLPAIRPVLHAREIPLLHERQQGIERRTPDRLVEDLHLDRAPPVPGALYGLPDTPQLDHTVAHHPAVHQHVLHGHQPAGDVERDEPPGGPAELLVE